jgi:hypothetical protein
VKKPKYFSSCLTILCILLILVSAASALEVTRVGPDKISEQEEILFTLQLAGEVGEKVVVGEQVQGAVFLGWGSEGIEGILFSQEGDTLIWEGTLSDPVSRITYRVRTPLSGDEVFLDVVYANEMIHGNSKDALTVQSQEEVDQPVIVEQPSSVDSAGMLNAVPLLVVFCLVLSGTLYLRKRWYVDKHHDEGVFTLLRDGFVRAREKISKLDVQNSDLAGKTPRKTTHTRKKQTTEEVELQSLVNRK